MRISHRAIGLLLSAVVAAGLVVGLSTAVTADAASASSEPDTQSAVDLAIRLATPLGPKGKADPKSFVNRGDVVRDDRDLAGAYYRTERNNAIRVASAAGNPFLPEEDRRRYAHCSQYMSTVILNTIDPMYPGDLTAHQYPYMKNPANGWVQVGTSESYDPSTYKPGDVFLTRGPGHTFMWIGEHGGYSDVVAEASFAAEDSAQLKLPSLKRYSINTNTGIDGDGRAYDVWRFVGRDGDPEPPDPDDSWDYRNIFTDFSVTAINAPTTASGRQMLGSGSSSLVVEFTMNVPNDAKSGDDFTIQSSTPYPFRAFKTFPITTADGTTIATAHSVSPYAVKIVLFDAVTTRQNISGRVSLTTGATPSTEKTLKNQRLVFFGGERELGPGNRFDIRRWSPPPTGLLGSAQIYDNEPGILTYVVYRFGEKRDFEPENVVASFDPLTDGVSAHCEKADLWRYEWLSSTGPAPVGGGRAVVVGCDVHGTVTARLPEDAKPPKEATGVRLHAPWVADKPASEYRFSATLRAPGLDTDTDRWSHSFVSSALAGDVDGDLAPAPEKTTAAPSLQGDAEPAPAGLSMPAWIALALIGAAAVFSGGFALGRRHRRGDRGSTR